MSSGGVVTWEETILYLGYIDINMDFLKILGSTLSALFMLFFFVIFVLPALGEATGQNVIGYIFSLLLIGFAVIIAAVVSFFKLMRWKW